MIILPHLKTNTSFCSGNWALPEVGLIELGLEAVIVVANVFYGFWFFRNFFDQLSRFLHFSKHSTGAIRWKAQGTTQEAVPDHPEAVRAGAHLHRLHHRTVDQLGGDGVPGAAQLCAVRNLPGRARQLAVHLPMFTFSEARFRRVCCCRIACTHRSLFQLRDTAIMREIAEYPSKDEVVNPGRRRIKTGTAHLIPKNFKKKGVKVTASSTDSEELRKEESAVVDL